MNLTSVSKLGVFHLFPCHTYIKLPWKPSSKWFFAHMCSQLSDTLASVFPWVLRSLVHCEFLGLVEMVNNTFSLYLFIDD